MRAVQPARQGLTWVEDHFPEGSDRPAALLAFRPRSAIAAFAAGSTTSAAPAPAAAAVLVGFAAVIAAFRRFALRAAVLAAETALAAVTTAAASTAMSALAVALIALAPRLGGGVTLGFCSSWFVTAEDALEPAHEPARFLYRCGLRLRPALWLRLWRPGF